MYLGRLNLIFFATAKLLCQKALTTFFCKKTYFGRHHFANVQESIEFNCNTEVTTSFSEIMKCLNKLRVHITQINIHRQIYFKIQQLLQIIVYK